MIDKLKEIRLKNNYKQEYVASELGITQKAYSKLENGQTCLTVDKIFKLAIIYNTSPGYFISLTCECPENTDIKNKIKDFLKEKGIELPNFLK